MSMSKKDFIDLADRIRCEETFIVNSKSVKDRKDNFRRLVESFCQSQNSAFLPGRFWGYVDGENGPCGGNVKS